MSFNKNIKTLKALEVTIPKKIFLHSKNYLNYMNLNFSQTSSQLRT